MLEEFWRKVRRVTFGTNPLTILAIWIALTAGLLLFIWQTTTFRQAQGVSEGIAVVRMLLIYAMMPIVSYGVIAGEREKRTWDALLSAPVTHFQITIGKYVGILAIPALVYVATVPVEYGSFMIGQGNPINYFRMLLNSVSFTFFEASLILFFSARARRPLSALGTILVILVTYLIWSIGTANKGDTGFAGTLDMFNAFSVFNFSVGFRYPNLPAIFSFYPEIGSSLFLTLAATMVTYAEKTISFADRDIPFLPKQLNARSKELT